MKKRPDDLTKFLENLKNEDYCYLTTMGRVTGNPHEIEIWFELNATTLYILSGGRDKSDWVRNSMKNPAVVARIKKHIFTGTARIVTEEKEETMARYLLAEKYQEWESGRTLSEWARTALPVAIDVEKIF